VKNLEQATKWILNRRRKILRYDWVPSAVMGVLLLVGGYVSETGHLHLILEGKQARGTIVDCKEYRHSTRTSFRLMVEFEANQQRIRFEDWLGRSDRRATGEPVSVLYDPANPSHAIIDRAILNWLPWGPCVALGLLLTLSSLKRWLATLGRPSRSR
jgi:hypothetical protein